MPVNESSIINNDSALPIPRQFARWLGWNEAGILQQLHWHTQEGHGQFIEGVHWIRMSETEWMDEIPLDEKAIQRAIKNLINDGLVRSAVFTGRCKWYTVDYEAVDTLTGPVERIVQKSETRKAARACRIDPVRSLDEFNGKDTKRSGSQWRVLRQLIWDRDGRMCTFCKCDLSKSTDYHCHHLLPESLGGLGSPENLCTACEDCHKKIHSSEGYDGIPSNEFVKEQSVPLQIDDNAKEQSVRISIDPISEGDSSYAYANGKEQSVPIDQWEQNGIESVQNVPLQESLQESDKELLILNAGACVRDEILDRIGDLCKTNFANPRTDPFKSSLIGAINKFTASKVLWAIELALSPEKANGKPKTWGFVLGILEKDKDGSYDPQRNGVLSNGQSTYGNRQANKTQQKGRSLIPRAMDTTSIEREIAELERQLGGRQNGPNLSSN